MYNNQTGDLKQVQMENLFPLYRDTLKLYDMCMDNTGKVVKNEQYFKDYQSRPHRTGKRGGAPSAVKQKHKAKR